MKMKLLKQGSLNHAFFAVFKRQVRKWKIILFTSCTYKELDMLLWAFVQANSSVHLSLTGLQPSKKSHDDPFNHLWLKVFQLRCPVGLSICQSEITH